MKYAPVVAQREKSSYNSVIGTLKIEQAMLL